MISETAIIESGVVVETGVQIGHLAVILAYSGEGNATVIGESSTIGANATIYPGVKIGHFSVVLPGSVVTKNVPANAIVSGNPASISGFVGTGSLAAGQPDQYHPSSISDVSMTKVGAGILYTLPLIPDLRGSLAVAEYEKHIPFMLKRCFWVFDVPSREVRGEHAHKELHQYLICLKGSVNVVLDDGNSRTEVVLDKSNLGLYVPPLVWAMQYKYSSDAVLLVLASDAYDPQDYLRDYDDFIAYVTSKREGQ
jgi:UDP-2-acetamido-3-amino-2,3-dideoxy-glucuronate N-acetyltransferase